MGKVMTITSNPFTSVNIVNASLEVSNDDQRILFVGQQVSGTAVSGELTENILDDNAWDALYGPKSQIAGMIRAARSINKVVRFDAIGLDDAGAAVEATGSIGFAGTATEGGSIAVSVASSEYSVNVAIASGDTAAAVAGNVTTALQALANLPVAVVLNSADVELTASNGGTSGNSIGISAIGTVAGIVVTVTGMSSGATDPTLTDIFDVVGDNRYQTVVWPYGTDVAELVGFLDPRFNVDNNVLDGVGITAVDVATATHLSRLGALNSENLVELCDAPVSTALYKGPAVFEQPERKAAMFGAIRALRLADGASVSQYVNSSNGALDSFGGAALASKPYFNTPFPDLPLVSVGNGFTALEISQIQDAGGAVLGNNSASTEVVLGQCPTTYKTDSAGNVDLTFKWLNYRDTASGAREYFFNNLKKRFAQSRLTQGNIVKGRDMANELVIKSYCELLYQDLAGVDYVLVQDGDQAIQFFKTNLVVSLDMSEGKATIQMETPIVTQLRTIIATMKIAFSAEA